MTCPLCGTRAAYAHPFAHGVGHLLGLLLGGWR